MDVLARSNMHSNWHLQVVLGPWSLVRSECQAGYFRWSPLLHLTGATTKGFSLFAPPQPGQIHCYSDINFFAGNCTVRYLSLRFDLGASQDIQKGSISSMGLPISLLVWH